MPPSYDPEKLADAVLALLGAFEFDNGRVWKTHDWDTLNRLHEAGLITDPRSANKSVYLTPEGLARAKSLAQARFGSVSA